MDNIIFLFSRIGERRFSNRNHNYPLILSINLIVQSSSQNTRLLQSYNSESILQLPNIEYPG